MEWKIVEKTKGNKVAFKDVVTNHGEKALVRIGMDGVVFFGKTGKASASQFNPGDLACTEDFRGTCGEGFKEIQCGSMAVDGCLWFSDGIFESLADGEYLSIKKKLLEIGDHYRDMLGLTELYGTAPDPLRAIEAE